MKLSKIYGLLIVILFSCKNNEVIQPESEIKSDIDVNLNLWHNAAAEASFEDYFRLMTNDAVFIGTDATENWQLDTFKSFSKPYFDKGKAWSFKALERNIYLSDDKKLAWFDELLDTQMELCRGSGIIEKTVDGWKVKHYVLSIAIPNDNIKEVVNLKQKTDSILKIKLLKTN